MFHYQKDLDKACFQHGMAYWDFKDLTRRTASNKILRDKAFDFAKNLKYNGYQGGLALMVYKSLIKKTSGGGIKRLNEIMPNKELAEVLHKLIIRKLEKRKVHSSFIDDIWGADLADIQLISSSFKKKQEITISNTSEKILDKSKRKLNKILVNKGSESYSRTMKSLLQNNDM